MGIVTSPLFRTGAPDGHAEPSPSADDRGHDGPQSLAGDAAILSLRRCEVQPSFQPAAGSARHGAGPLARLQWLADRRAELLPVPYFHVVFTLPAPVAAIALQNKAVVYDILFKAAAETIRTIGADPKHLGAKTEAICEAAQRPSMRFVPVKSEEQQANGVVFRARDLLVRQRTQCINALRGHLSEYGCVFPQGITHADAVIAHVEDPDSSVPESARAVLKVLIGTFQALEAQIQALDAEITQRAKADPVARRLMTIPGIGPIAATAITALVPAPEGFRAGRDFAAWLGLTPLQKSTGGKQRLGAISKMGERTIRRLLILGASAVVRWAGQRGTPAGSWLARMLARKPKMLVTVALANKTARIVWALLVKGGVYRAPAPAA